MNTQRFSNYRETKKWNLRTSNSMDMVNTKMKTTPSSISIGPDISLQELILKEILSLEISEQSICRWSRLLKLDYNLNQIGDVFLSTCQTRLIVNHFADSKAEIISICFHCILCVYLHILFLKKVPWDI